jgi:hypothetical protein
MVMKKLVNDPKNVVDEAVAGFGAAHGDIVRVSLDPVFIVRSDAPVAGKVGIVSGGRRPPTRSSRPPRLSTAEPVCCTS